MRDRWARRGCTMRCGERQRRLYQQSVTEARAELTVLNAQARALGYESAQDALVAIAGYQLARTVRERRTALR